MNSPAALKPGPHWHGTAETITGRLAPGGYDGVLWTSDVMEIALSYIPAASGSILWSPRRESQDSDRVRPDLHGALWTTALALGFPDVDVTRDDLGRALSWPATTPTIADLKGALRALGHDPDEQQWLPMRNGIVTRKGDDLKGSLYQILVPAGLRILDLRTGDFDGTNPSYHDLETFSKAREAGYDAVAIDDLSTDRDGERLGHDSLGLLPKGIEKCTFCDPIPASHMRFGEWFGKMRVSRTA